jgi:hypothetical protein
MERCCCSALTLFSCLPSSFLKFYSFTVFLYTSTTLFGEEGGGGGGGMRASAVPLYM